MSTLNNSVRLAGFLGSAPKVKFTENEKKYATFDLATNEYQNNDKGEKIKEVNFHPIILWERQAALAEKYLGKGSRIAIEGRLVTRYYTDKDGVRHRATQVVVSEMEFLTTAPKN